MLSDHQYRIYARSHWCCMRSLRSCLRDPYILCVRVVCHSGLPIVLGEPVMSCIIGGSSSSSKSGSSSSSSSSSQQEPRVNAVNLAPVQQVSTTNNSITLCEKEVGDCSA
jgi:hypothetical protein